VSVDVLVSVGFQVTFEDFKVILGDNLIEASGTSTQFLTSTAMTEFLSKSMRWCPVYGLPENVSLVSKFDLKLDLATIAGSVLRHDGIFI
jgi:hypothetical protein